MGEDDRTWQAFHDSLKRVRQSLDDLREIELKGNLRKEFIHQIDFAVGVLLYLDEVFENRLDELAVPDGGDDEESA